MIDIFRELTDNSRDLTDKLVNLTDNLAPTLENSYLHPKSELKSGWSTL